MDRWHESGLDDEILEWAGKLDRDPDELLAEKLECFTTMLDWRHAQDAAPMLGLRLPVAL